MPGEILLPETAIARLATVLFETMEHLDTTEGFDWDIIALENWENLPAYAKSFYIHCIRRLAIERELWAAVNSDDGYLKKRSETATKYKTSVDLLPFSHSLPKSL